jgi:hypothetical protein
MMRSKILAGWSANRKPSLIGLGKACPFSCASAGLRSLDSTFTASSHRLGCGAHDRFAVGHSRSCAIGIDRPHNRLAAEDLTDTSPFRWRCELAGIVDGKKATEEFPISTVTSGLSISLKDLDVLSATLTQSGFGKFARNPPSNENQPTLRSDS